MTVRFAHLADAHLGAFRDRELRRLNLEAFLEALDVVRREGCEFLVIAGDLFHTNLPDLATVERATAAMRALRDDGIRIYSFYGSHDRSPTETGIVEVLASAGVFEHVGVLDGTGDVVTLRTVTDGPTGAVLAAIDGRRRSLERSIFGVLDRKALAGAIEGAPLAIFGYHGPVEGMIPKDLEERAHLEPVDPRELPSGFDYYALGHIHSHIVREVPGGGTAAYPGPTFGASFTDLADEGAKGIIIVDVRAGGECLVRHVPIEVVPIERLDLDVEGMTGEEAREELSRMSKARDPSGKLVLMRTHGALSRGRPAELNVPKVREDMIERHALAVFVNRGQLKAPDPVGMGSGDGAGPGADPGRIAREVFQNAVEGHESPLPWLRGDPGAGLAWDLFEILKAGPGEMSKREHRARMERLTLALFSVTDRPGLDARPVTDEREEDGDEEEGDGPGTCTPDGSAGGVGR